MHKMHTTYDNNNVDNDFMYVFHFAVLQFESFFTFSSFSSASSSSLFLLLYFRNNIEHDIHNYNIMFIYIYYICACINKKEQNEKKKKYFNFSNGKRVIKLLPFFYCARRNSIYVVCYM